jgi:hypothetical protein
MNNEFTVYLRKVATLLEEEVNKCENFYLFCILTLLTKCIRNEKQKISQQHTTYT